MGMAGHSLAGHGMAWQGRRGGITGVLGLVVL